MIAKAKARFIRVSPRKMRQVVDVIRGKSVDQALAILANLNKSAAALAEDVLKSAISNARNNPDIKDEALYISRMMVDGGPTLKRFRAASMGRASTILHRTSHITVELDLVPKKIIKSPKSSKVKRIRKKRA